MPANVRCSPIPNLPAPSLDARTRAFRFNRDFGQALAQALILDGTFRARVCVGGRAQDPAQTGGGSGGSVPQQPSINGRPCTTSAQCGSGAICGAPSPGQPKVCLLV
jgi:hypothetical protein